MARALLISIQPKFAEAILNGSKTMELRRTTPTLPPAALALIYSSSPTKALIGWATVEEILQAPPNDLWDAHQSSTGVTCSEFQDYFAGKSHAFGLRLSSPRRADKEISLASLRRHGLQPPQSWRYVPIHLAQALLKEMSSPAAFGRTHSLRHEDLVAAVG